MSGFDYSLTAAYFVTVCTRNQIPFFGRIAAGAMKPNRLGKIVTRCWDEIPAHFSGIVLDAFMLMPNHIHGILVLPAWSRAYLPAIPMPMPENLCWVR